MIVKTQCILIVSNNQDLVDNFATLPYFNEVYDIQTAKTLPAAINILNNETSQNFQNSPDVIFLDLKNLLSDAIVFLEAISKNNFKRLGQRIIFLVNKESVKEASILKAIGDFEFVCTPVTEEKMFNCLVNQPVFSH